MGDCFLGGWDGARRGLVRVAGVRELAGTVCLDVDDVAPRRPLLGTIGMRIGVGAGVGAGEVADSAPVDGSREAAIIDNRAMARSRI